MHDSSPPWLAVHLYHNMNWEKILVEAVAPFVQRMMHGGYADKFFFIRYWERGPHIRLRFSGTMDNLKEQIKPQLILHFEDYFRRNPSVRPEPSWLATLPAEQRWLPNNSLHFIPYEPEIERYGGPEAIHLAESQFQASSEAVLNILQTTPNWSYEKALGIAVQLHLSMAHSLGMTLPDAQHFFAATFVNWFGHAYNVTLPDLHTPMDEHTQVLMTAFRESFARHKPVLVRFHQQCWDGLEAKADFEIDWLNDWIHRMQSIHRALQRAKLVTTATNQRPEWHIAESFLHMTNNRLGILNRDEAYLGYLLKESIQAMLL